MVLETHNFSVRYEYHFLGEEVKKKNGGGDAARRENNAMVKNFAEKKRARWQTTGGLQPAIQSEEKRAIRQKILALSTCALRACQPCELRDES